MSEAIKAALLCVGATCLTNFVLFAFFFGDLRRRVLSHSELLGKLPCLEPGAAVTCVKGEK